MFKNKTCYIVVIFCVVIISIILYLYNDSWPKQNSQPFAELNNDDIVKIYAEYGTIPFYELTSEEQYSLLTLLHDVEIFYQDDDWPDYLGFRSVMFYIETVDGAEITVSGSNPFFFINSIAYRTSYEPCDRVREFYSNLFNTKIRPKEQ